jgi:hypothetical protein
MAPDLLPKLAEHGTTGLLLAIALWVCWKLYGENKRLHEAALAQAAQCRAEIAAEQAKQAAVQERRVADAQAVQQAMIASTAETVASMNNLDASLEGNRLALVEVHKALADSGLGDRGTLAHAIEALRGSVDALIASRREGGRRT